MQGYRGPYTIFSLGEIRMIHAMACRDQCESVNDTTLKSNIIEKCEAALGYEEDDRLRQPHK